MRKIFALMLALMLTGVVFTSCGDDGDDDTTSQVAEYTIKYDPNGGTGTIANTTYKAGDKVTLADGSGFTRDGYAFMGWASSPDGTSFDANDIIGKNVTLYAVWKKIENGGDNGGNGGNENGNDNPEVVEVKAAFGVSPTAQMQPSMNVNCYADSIPGDDIRYEWNFGDGTGSVWANNNEYQSTLVHIYETYGEYIITLTVKSKDKSDVATQTIKILPAPPTSIMLPTKYEGVAPFTLTFTEDVLYSESVKWAIYRVENNQRDAEPLCEITNKVGETQPYTFENPGTYYVDLTAYGPGSTEEGLLMRTDTVVVTPGEPVIPESLPAFFPTGYDKANVVAWYSVTTKDEEEIRTESVFLFGDEKVVVSQNQVKADGSVTRSFTFEYEVMAGFKMPLMYQLTEGSTFENGTANVGVALKRDAAQAFIQEGVLMIPAFAAETKFVLQDNANIPAPCDPTK